MKKFILEINLGNDAMRTLNDIANVLSSVRNQLVEGFKSGSIRDDNGNMVGYFCANIGEKS